MRGSKPRKAHANKSKAPTLLLQAKLMTGASKTFKVSEAVERRAKLGVSNSRTKETLAESQGGASENLARSQ